MKRWGDYTGLERIDRSVVYGGSITPARRETIARFHAAGIDVCTALETAYADLAEDYASILAGDRRDVDSVGDAHKNAYAAYITLFQKTTMFTRGVVKMVTLMNLENFRDMSRGVMRRYSRLIDVEDMTARVTARIDMMSRSRHQDRRAAAEAAAVAVVNASTRYFVRVACALDLDCVSRDKGLADHVRDASLWCKQIGIRTDACAVMFQSIAALLRLKRAVDWEFDEQLLNANVAAVDAE